MVAHDDRAVRVQVARAEALRAGGVPELIELSRSSDVGTRVLALRGLGRTGGAQALRVLDEALSDHEPRVVAAAIGAIGVAFAIDEQTGEDRDAYLPITNVTQKIIGAMNGHEAIALEALGRAGDASAQPVLAKALADPKLAEVAAIALGRHGRRKIALVHAASTALFVALNSHDANVRYAAVYALAREHEPHVSEPSLEWLLEDPDPMVRAQTIAALDKRKQARLEVVGPLFKDPDRRVGVEAVRAIGAAENAWVVLANTVSPDGASLHPQVREEALRQLVTHLKPADYAATMLDKLSLTGREACFAKAALARPVPELVEACHGIDLAILADVIKRNGTDDAWKRAALRVLLESSDARVRAAGIGAMEWVDHVLAAKTAAAALASKDPIIAGATVETIADPQFLFDAALEDALIARATIETDPELSSDLYVAIASRKFGAGADACRAGLSGPPVRARAAADCLRALGEAVPPPAIGTETPPPVDVATVIGHHITWRLDTDKGPIEILLLPDIAPWNVATIVALTQKGFYDGLAFHRVVPDFVVQGGDPTQSGWGGPGFTTPAEPTSLADGASFVVGGVGIADAGRDSGGSQYFVMHSPAPHLDGRYTQVGRLISGQKSADALLIGDRVLHATVEIR
jgi:cyclophilin family peptidyl-prolyl cis-trans isomerase/HEAT repeat protein